MLALSSNRFINIGMSKWRHDSRDLNAEKPAPTTELNPYYESELAIAIRLKISAPFYLVKA